MLSLKDLMCGHGEGSVIRCDAGNLERATDWNEGLCD
jgi:hypothetical protein